MKELSIEEKAERYDEAIIRAKKVLLDCTPEEQKVVEYITPELKESEDEKVRKGIIKSIMDLNTNWLELHGITKKNAISWLEKQGEQKPAELSNTCEFSIKTWINIVAYVLKEHNGIGNYLDDPEVKDTAEKLQKRYKFDSASEEWDRVYRKGLDAGVNKGKAIALREKNHAWSEEDERHFSWLIEHLGQSAGLYDNLIDWLKSLKDRIQSKVELTQLDKNILEATIAFVELNNRFNCWRGVDRQTVLSALHSLEPQNTWKPSYEQMNKLCWIANQNKDNMIGKELMTLYNDLKKLREK